MSGDHYVKNQGDVREALCWKFASVSMSAEVCYVFHTLARVLMLMGVV